MWRQELGEEQTLCFLENESVPPKQEYNGSPLTVPNLPYNKTSVNYSSRRMQRCPLILTTQTYTLYPHVHIIHVLPIASGKKNVLNCSMNIKYQAQV